MSDDHHVGVATGAASSSEGATTFNLVHDSIEEGGEERERENDSQNSIVVGDDPDKKGREEEGGGREQSSRGVGNEDVVSETSIGSVAVGPLAFLLKLVPVLVTLSSSSSPRYQHQHYFAAITADTTAILFISLASFSRYCFSF